MPALSGTTGLRSFALSFAVCMGLARSAVADDAWLVTEVRIGAEGGAVSLDRIAESLRHHRQSVISASSAAADFERLHSRTPAPLSTQELQQFDKDLRALADHLSSDDLPQVRPLLRRFADLPPATRDFLNRDTARARRRFHICLLAGHLLAKLGSDAEGLQQARLCMRDFPGFQPEQGSYLPESIRNFFERALREQRSIRPATLRLDTQNRRERACRARVNGIDEGPLPASVVDVRAERVRVEVDCGNRVGRTYDVALHPGDNSILIDESLDSAVSTQDGLSLNYADSASARALALDHGIRLGSAVGAEHVLQVSGGELVRIEVSERRTTARASIDDGPLDEVVGRLVGPGVKVPASADAPHSGSSHYAVLGWGSAGAALIGAAVVVVGWRMHESAIGRFNATPQCLFADPQAADKCNAKLDQAASAQSIMVVGAVAGGSFAALSLVMFLLDAENSPKPARSVARACRPGPGDLGLACGLRF